MYAINYSSFKLFDIFILYAIFALFDTMNLILHTNSFHFQFF